MDQEDLKAKIRQLVEINHIEKIEYKDIVLNKKIGEGGQAIVYKATYRGETVAVKLLENIDLRCLAHEIVIIANLQHPNIPRFYGIVSEPNNLSLIFEYIDARNLNEFKYDELNDNIRMNIVKQLASVLEYIHLNNFIHRDLKPENLMFNKKSNTIYLIDFGIAKVLLNNINTKTRTKGTLHYLAPETFSVTDYDSDDNIVSTIGPQVDCWAFGCIVSWLYSNSLPWCNKYNNNDTILQKLLMTKREFPIPENILDQSIIKIISKCTQIKVDERWSMKEVRQFLDTL